MSLAAKSQVRKVLGVATAAAIAMLGCGRAAPPKVAVEKATAEAGANGAAVVLHQDAFAAGYDDDEYTLLGMAIKYAGLYRVTINVVGKCEETFRRA